jgi:hypothetical protein
VVAYVTVKFCAEHETKPLQIGPEEYSPVQKLKPFLSSDARKAFGEVNTVLRSIPHWVLVPDKCFPIFLMGYTELLDAHLGLDLKTTLSSVFEEVQKSRRAE